MARPLWLRLFGPNGPTTFAELREALLASPIGDRLGEGRLIDRLEHIIDRAPPPVRGVTIPVIQAPAQQADVAAAVVLEHDLAAAPASVQAPAAEVAAPAIEEMLSSVQSLPQDAAISLTGPGSDGRAMNVLVNGVVPGRVAGVPSSPLARLDTSAQFALLGDIQTGLVIDTRTKSLLPGGPGDYPEMLAGRHDAVELNGDYSAGFGFTVPAGVEQVILQAGNDYNLIAGDEAVAAGAILTINAMPLRADHHVLFDGSAETDGSFLFYGSESADLFIGGAGDDVLYGLGGGDILSGGAGRDTFVYNSVDHSTGADFDTIADFNAAEDRIDLDFTVAGFDAAIAGGALSIDSFDADLAAALAGLGAGRAAFYAPDAGDLAGTIFLVVDANGVAGYQEGEDYVFALAGTTLGDLSGHTDFFI